MGDITNVKMGVCSVTFDDTDLGHTIGGVTVAYEPEYHDIMVDKHGNTVAEKVLIGENLQATVPLAEHTVANLLEAIPAGTSGGTDARVEIGKDAGERMKQYAAQLVLHPEANTASDLSEDVVIHKALIVEPIEFEFSNEGEKIVEVVFQAIIDDTKSDGNYLGLIGDSSA